jgi:hypothetical protein
MRTLRWWLVSMVILACGFGLVSSAGGSTNAEWLVTRSMAASDLTGGRFPNIRSVTCAPDTSSATEVFGQARWWQKFWCAGYTNDAVKFRLRYKATGKCDSCWTISNLTGTGASQLRTRQPLRSKPTPRTNPTPPSGGAGSCPTGWYLNVYGNCIPGPSPSPDLPVPGGPTAICRDGTYSYSQSRSGTCSHHGGVSSWLT